MMGIYESLLNREKKLAIVGLGYVGLPLALAFAKLVPVIGFDTSSEKIKKYQKGIDPTREVGDTAVSQTEVEFTDDETRLKEANFIIVAVPTPINKDKSPDLYAVQSASVTVGRNLQKNTVVVYESTVYPGVTEEVCLPILEKASGLQAGADFFIGYSPERINPGDKVHRLENITKITSGMDKETAEIVARVYELVIRGGVHRAPSIKVAEAAKVAENSQRDINIAFMNELSMIFHRMDIDTRAVVEAMNTKWNALGFTPGLVGGHCIGVDPYYFIYQAENLGYHSQIILAGRQINDGMSHYVVAESVKRLMRLNKPISEMKVAVLGITFKENCADIRNSRVIDIIEGLKEYGLSPLVTDPVADAQEVWREYQLLLTPMEALKEMDCVIVAVMHSEFLNLHETAWQAMMSTGTPCDKLVIDVKGALDKDAITKIGIGYWRL